MSSDFSIVACVPAYNEEAYIASVLIRLKKYVDVIIVCDDGSSDLTSEISKALGASVIRHENNLGYGAALQSLFREAIRLDADIIVTIDADNQHNPKEAELLVKSLIDNDYDIVIGSRFNNKNKIPSWRRSGIEIINTLTVKDLGLTDSQSGFRAYKRKALELLNLSENGMGISTEILIKAKEAGLILGEVPINIEYFEDSSTHSPLVHGLDVILSTVKHLSIQRPLLFFGFPGITILTFSILMWGYTLRIYTLSKIFITNLAIIALSATLIGLILMTTSIIIWVMISVLRENVK